MRSARGAAASAMLSVGLNMLVIVSEQDPQNWDLMNFYAAVENGEATIALRDSRAHTYVDRAAVDGRQVVGTPEPDSPEEAIALLNALAAVRF